VNIKEAYKQAKIYVGRPLTLNIFCSMLIDYRRGSRILKWEVNFLHLNQRNQILFQYLRDKKKKRKKGAQKKGGGGENSPISPPLGPRLDYA